MWGCTHRPSFKAALKSVPEISADLLAGVLISSQLSGLQAAAPGCREEWAWRVINEREGNVIMHGQPTKQHKSLWRLQKGWIPPLLGLEKGRPPG